MLQELIREQVIKVYAEHADCDRLIFSILQDQKQVIEEGKGFRKTLLRVFGLDSGLGRVLHNYYLLRFLRKYSIDLDAAAEFYISLQYPNFSIKYPTPGLG